MIVRPIRLVLSQKYVDLLMGEGILLIIQSILLLKVNDKA